MKKFDVILGNQILKNEVETPLTISQILKRECDLPTNQYYFEQDDGTVRRDLQFTMMREPGLSFNTKLGSYRIANHCVSWGNNTIKTHLWQNPPLNIFEFLKRTTAESLRSELHVLMMDINLNVFNLVGLSIERTGLIFKAGRAMKVEPISNGEKWSQIIDL